MIDDKRLAEIDGFMRQRDHHLINRTNSHGELMDAVPELVAEVRRLREALSKCAYAHFEIKRMVPEAVVATMQERRTKRPARFWMVSDPRLEARVTDDKFLDPTMTDELRMQYLDESLKEGWSISAVKASWLRAKLADAERKLPCGHPAASLVDDQCGKPEHRFCIDCHNKKCYEETDAAYGEALDEIDSLKSKLAAADEKLKSEVHSNIAMREARDAAEKRATDAEKDARDAHAAKSRWRDLQERTNACATRYLVLMGRMAALLKCDAPRYQQPTPGGPWIKDCGGCAACSLKATYEAALHGEREECTGGDHCFCGACIVRRAAQMGEKAP